MLANQAQRHAALRAVSARVRTKLFNEFMHLMATPHTSYDRAYKHTKTYPVDAVARLRAAILDLKYQGRKKPREQRQTKKLKKLSA